jgi:hypothetical protein
MLSSGALLGARCRLPLFSSSPPSRSCFCVRLGRECLVLWPLKVRKWAVCPPKGTAYTEARWICLWAIVLLCTLPPADAPRSSFRPLKRTVHAGPDALLPESSLKRDLRSCFCVRSPRSREGGFRGSPPLPSASLFPSRRIVLLCTAPPSKNNRPPGGGSSFPSGSLPPLGASCFCVRSPAPRPVLLPSCLWVHAVLSGCRLID